MKIVNTKREELHALLAGGAVYRVGDEFVGQLGDRLQPAGHQRPRRAARRPAAPQMPTTTIAMYSAELVNAISCPPIWPSGTMLWISN